MFQCKTPYCDLRNQHLTCENGKFTEMHYIPPSCEPIAVGNFIYEYRLLELLADVVLSL